MIKSHLLYQLSYAPGTVRKAYLRGRRLAKRIPDVQQAAGISGSFVGNKRELPRPRFLAAPGEARAAGKPPEPTGDRSGAREKDAGGSSGGSFSTAMSSPNLLAGTTVAVVAIAIIAAIPAAIVAVTVKAGSMPRPASLRRRRTGAPWGQHGKAALLAVIQRLVERIGRIGDFLHGRRRGRHVVGALRRRATGSSGFCWLVVFSGIHPRIGAVDPQFGKFPHRSSRPAATAFPDRRSA